MITNTKGQRRYLHPFSSLFLNPKAQYIICEGDGGVCALWEPGMNGRRAETLLRRSQVPGTVYLRNGDGQFEKGGAYESLQMITIALPESRLRDDLVANQPI